MTYYVNEKCMGCKYTDCVSVCPVNCFYETQFDDSQNMLVIDPEVCIDCGICVLECPVDAIKSDCDSSIDISIIKEWVDYNSEYSKKFKYFNIVKKKMH